MWQVLSGVFLGWSLGSNDASNVFGTAVASRMVKFWTAALLCSFFVILGALVLVGIMGNSLNLGSLGKVVLCWVGTPIGAAVGAALVTIILYFALGQLMNRWQPSICDWVGGHRARGADLQPQRHDDGG